MEKSYDPVAKVLAMIRAEVRAEVEAESKIEIDLAWKRGWVAREDAYKKLIQDSSQLPAKKNPMIQLPVEIINEQPAPPVSATVEVESPPSKPKISIKTSAKPEPEKLYPYSGKVLSNAERETWLKPHTQKCAVYRGLASFEGEYATSTQVRQEAL